MIPWRGMQPSTARDSGQVDSRRSTTDIPPPQSAALGLQPVARRLLLINRPRRDGTLSRRWYTAATGRSRTRDFAIAKSSLVPLGHRVPYKSIDWLTGWLIDWLIYCKSYRSRSAQLVVLTAFNPLEIWLPTKYPNQQIIGRYVSLCIIKQQSTCQIQSVCDLALGTGVAKRQNGMSMSTKSTPNAKFDSGIFSCYYFLKIVTASKGLYTPPGIRN